MSNVKGAMTIVYGAFLRAFASALSLGSVSLPGGNGPLTRLSPFIRYTSTLRGRKVRRAFHRGPELRPVLRANVVLWEWRRRVCAERRHRVNPAVKRDVQRSGQMRRRGRRER